MRTNTGCTVYNRYIVSGSEHYQRTELAAVAWQNRKAANVIASGLLAADSATIYIPFALGTNYVKPIAWQALSVKTGYWTLAIGDVIVKGLVTDEIHDAVVSPPSAAFTMTNLKAKYDDVVTIKSVDTMDAGSDSMRHWQIGAS
jgi:hypothetical protein